MCNVKAAVAAFNQEKALVGAFSVITNLRMELFEALVSSVARYLETMSHWCLACAGTRQMFCPRLAQLPPATGAPGPVSTTAAPNGLAAENHYKVFNIQIPAFQRRTTLHHYTIVTHRVVSPHWYRDTCPGVQWIISNI